MPPGVVATQMTQLVEHRGLAQGQSGLIIGENGSGTNAGGVGERMWSGTLTWQGTDTTWNERWAVRVQVIATASKGDPCAIFSVEFVSIEDLYSRTHPDWRLTWPQCFGTCATFKFLRRRGRAGLRYHEP